MTHLRGLLVQAAEALVPEHDPLGGTLDGVRRLVRRRRVVRRAQVGAGAVVGVVAIGSAALLTLPGPVTPAESGALCGESYPDVLPDPGEHALEGFATVQMSEGMSVSMRAQVENLSEVEVTTLGEVRLVVSLQGTGRVVGHGTASPDEQARIEPDSAGDVFATAALTSCGFAGTVAGDPLPDGTYDLTLIGSAATADGSEVPWTAGTNGITVEGGHVSESGVQTGPTEGAAFAPACGEMIPAVPENPMWASVAAAGDGPFLAADPDEPYVDGMTLDLTIGTTAEHEVSGELSPEVVTVLTDLDGRVVSWWRASDHDRPLDLGPALELEPQGSVVFAAFAWFPIVDTCAGDAAPIPDGSYRIFTWAEVTVGAEAGDAVERYAMVSVPLDVEARDGIVTLG